MASERFSSPDPGYFSPAGYPSPAESATLQTPALHHDSRHVEPKAGNILPLPRLFPSTSSRGIQLAHGNTAPFPAIHGSSDSGSPMKGDEFITAFSDGFTIETKINNYESSETRATSRSPPTELYFRSKEFHPSDDTPFDLDASVHSPLFRPGHKLNPHFVLTYRLEDALGSGGYGFVLTARHRVEGHEVAVKFIIKEKVPDHSWMEDEVMGKLPTEILLLSVVDHPNVVKCLDLFEDSLYFYLVQELHGTPWNATKPRHIRTSSISSGSLSPSTPALSPSGSASSLTSSSCSELPHTSNVSNATNNTNTNSYHSSNTLQIEKPSNDTDGRPDFRRRASHDLFECIEQSEHKRLSEDQARYVFSQVVDAVFYLDSQGITHRDIKDENIVIDKDFKVKLIDFGSASVVDPNGPRPFSNLFYGTTAYAASEILLKKEYQAPPAEIWTLGVLLSYLLTGTSPFPTAQDATRGRIVLADTPGTRLSRAAMGLMRRCLDPNPETRATISEVREHRWLTQKSL